MSEKIEPALTPEEWAERRILFDRPEGYEDWIEGGYAATSTGLVYMLEVEGCNRDTEMDRRHALAALALLGQPFGFTHEDVELLRLLASNFSAQGMFVRGDLIRWETTGAFYSSLADRIEALLPPRTP
jgi:hypothetical protein